MGNWEECVVNVLVTSLFAWMVYKLVFVVLDFHGENFRIQRAQPPVEDDDEPGCSSDADVGSAPKYVAEEDEMASPLLSADIAPERTGLKEDIAPRRAEFATTIKPPSLAPQECGIQKASQVEARGISAPHTSASAHTLSENTPPALAQSNDHIPNHDQSPTLVENAPRVESTGIPDAASPSPPLTDGRASDTLSSLGNEISPPPTSPPPPAALPAVPSSSTLPPQEDDEDDWEGVETSEAELAFHNASTFVASATMARALKFPPAVLLQLYGLYKQATYGGCDTPQPSMFSYAARAKWDAWKAVGPMSADKAMSRYVVLVTESREKWGPHEALGEGGSRQGGSGGGASGPVFSTFAEPQGGGGSDDENLPPLQSAASHGKEEEMRVRMREGEDVNAVDDTGRTALHWAADRGHVSIVEILIGGGAAVDLKDSEGQTALSYAVTCEYEEVARKLLDAGADPMAADKEGNTPYGARSKNWTWFPQASPKG